jgi:hypothetical protein
VSDAIKAVTRRPVVGRIVFYTVVVFVLFPMAFCYILTKPPGGAAGVAPSDYLQVHLVADGLEHRAWLRPGCPERVAFVVVHGMGDSLESFTLVANPLAERGHTVILPEVRGHGASRAPSTLGGREREEVRAALDYLRSNGHASPGIALMGFSMGAVATLRAAAGQDDIAAVIVEAPYDTYRNTIARHAKLYYHLPEWFPLIPISVAFAEFYAGFDADEVDAVAAARRITAPLLAIADGSDQRMPPEVVRRILDAHPGPKEFWIAPGVDHVGAMWHPEYWPRVIAFLESHAVSPPPVVDE